MKDKLKGWLQKGADKALGSELVRAKLIEAANRSRLARYGRVSRLELGVQRRQLRVTLTLHGEEQPVEVVVERFTLLGEEGDARVRLEEVRVDREWLQRLADDHVVGREWPLPPGGGKWAARALELFR